MNTTAIIFDHAELLMTAQCRYTKAPCFLTSVDADEEFKRWRHFMKALRYFWKRHGTKVDYALSSHKRAYAESCVLWLHGNHVDDLTEVSTDWCAMIAALELFLGIRLDCWQTLDDRLWQYPIPLTCKRIGLVWQVFARYRNLGPEWLRTLEQITPPAHNSLQSLNQLLL